MSMTVDQYNVHQQNLTRRDNVLRMCQRHGTYVGFYPTNLGEPIACYVCDGQLWQIAADWARQWGDWFEFAAQIRQGVFRGFRRATPA
ncbi:MAG: hypothetical protein EHM35_10845 [Planctomycetaceae bacterium]|nr:MAG: hypothetical protein EHM35_10845 [Planctomycetaceae bacterium]